MAGVLQILVSRLVAGLKHAIDEPVQRRDLIGQSLGGGLRRDVSTLSPERRQRREARNQCNGFCFVVVTPVQGDQCFEQP